jgi:hypothetical protein
MENLTESIFARVGNRCGLRFSKQLRKQEKTRNRMKLENLLHLGTGAPTDASNLSAVSVLLPSASSSSSAAGGVPRATPAPAMLKWDTVLPESFHSTS